jgi:hypothetical protein
VENLLSDLHLLSPTYRFLKKRSIPSFLMFLLYHMQGLFARTW